MSFAWGLTELIPKPTPRYGIEPVPSIFQTDDLFKINFACPPRSEVVCFQEVSLSKYFMHFYLPKLAIYPAHINLLDFTIVMIRIRWTIQISENSSVYNRFKSKRNSNKQVNTAITN
jgi:hypothetical protein